MLGLGEQLSSNDSRIRPNSQPPASQLHGSRGAGAGSGWALGVSQAYPKPVWLLGFLPAFEFRAVLVRQKPCVYIHTLVGSDDDFPAAGSSAMPRSTRRTVAGVPGGGVLCRKYEALRTKAAKDAMAVEPAIQQTPLALVIGLLVKEVADSQTLTEVIAHSNEVRREATSMPGRCDIHSRTSWLWHPYISSPDICSGL